MIQKEKPTMFDSIDAAISHVQSAEWTNGMATENVGVPITDSAMLRVMRKCDSLNHPELLRFEIEGVCPDDIQADITDEIKDALGFYGDVHIEFQDDDIAIVGI